MTGRHIALSDPRRHRRGNRTVRMPKHAWETLQHGPTPWPSVNAYARSVCRVSCPSDDYRNPDRPTLDSLLRDLVHGWYWASTPLLQRKKFAHAIRNLINQQREKRARLKGFLRPEQSACRLP